MFNYSMSRLYYITLSYRSSIIEKAKENLEAAQEKQRLLHDRPQNHNGGDSGTVGGYECTLPPQPISQTLFSIFPRVWFRDYSPPPNTCIVGLSPPPQYLTTIPEHVQ